MSTTDKRRDLVTAKLVEEALKMDRAFGKDAAVRFLQLRSAHQTIAERVLALTAPGPRRHY